MSGNPEMTDNRPHVIKSAKGKRPHFYDVPGMDQAMSMIMVLANELAVLHDRMDSAERILASNGIDFAKGIEQLELDQKALEAREAWRQDFLDRLFYLMRKDAADAASAATAESYRKTIEDIAVG